MIDLNELEEYARSIYGDNSKIPWQLDMDKDYFFDTIFGYLGECFEALPNKKKAERSVHIIVSTVYYYIWGVENRSLKRSKDKLQEREKAIEKKVSDFKEILWDDYRDDDPLYKLIEILDDMKKHPWRYAKIPDHVPEAELSRGYVIDTIVSTLSTRLDQKKCVNAAKKTIKNLPK